MAEDKATFTFSIDEDASGPASSAAAALANLRDELTKDTRAMSEMKRAMSDMKKGGLEASTQYAALAKAVDVKTQSIALGRAKYIELGGSFKKTTTAANSFGGRLKQLTVQMKGDVTKSNQAMTDQLKKLSEEMGGGRVLRLLGSRVALMGAVTVATFAGIAMLVKYGIAQAEARQADHLRLEGLVKLRNYWARAAGNADEMQASLDKVSASTALGRDKLAQYQTELYKMGLRGKNLEMTLEGMAIKSVTQGEEQARMFAGWAAGLAHTGGSVEKFANDVKARLGGLAAKHMMQLDVQVSKLRENMAALFFDVKVEKLQKARGLIFDLFSKATPSGQALSRIMTGWTQPFIDGMSSATPFLRDFIRGAILFVLKLTNAFLDVRLAIKRAFVDVPAIHSIKSAAGVGYAAVMLLAVGFGWLAVMVTMATWPVLLAIAAIWGLYQVFTQLGDFFSEDIDWLKIGADLIGDMASGIWEGAKGLVGAIGDVNGWMYDAAMGAIGKWFTIGKDIVLGIVKGIWAVDKLLFKAMQDIGDGAWKAFKKAIGSSSPSKLFAEAGRTIPQGIKVGIEADAGDVKDAVAKLAPVAVASMHPDIAPRAPDAAGGDAASGDSGASARGNGATSITINSVTVNASGGDAKSMATDFVRELEAALESAALSMGAIAHG